MILAGTFPLSADPGEVFFIISILKQSSRYRRRQRVGTSCYCYDLYYVPPAIVFFAAERPWFNLGAYWVVKPLKLVFYDLKGRGPLKAVKNLRECWQVTGVSIDTTRTPLLFSFYTTFNVEVSLGTVGTCVQLYRCIFFLSQMWRWGLNFSISLIY